jgi:hypothetical protein
VSDQTNRLVGENTQASQPTNQETPSGEVPLWMSDATRLFYLSAEAVERTGLTRVGSGSLRNGVFRLAEEHHPRRLREQVRGLKNDLARVQRERDSLRVAVDVYESRDAAAWGERDRARETAMRLEEELAMAHRNIEHLRLGIQAFALALPVFTKPNLDNPENVIGVVALRRAMASQAKCRTCNAEGGTVVPMKVDE